MSLTLMYITNDPEVALIAQNNGVDRIWIDLERLGKEERQKGMNTVKSKHVIEDILRIKPLLTTSEMLVRVNPWNEKSQEEIDSVIEAGADIVMLPMWKSSDEVKKFISVIDGRAKTTLLLETKEAVECIDEILKIKGVDEIHIGLNDLHLSYNLSFMFELLANGTVEYLCKKFKKAGIPYGFGGIAKLGQGDLPAEKVILEHYRLGSTRTILSRSFCNTDLIKNTDQVKSVFSENISALRAFEEYAKSSSLESYRKNNEEMKTVVKDIVKKRKESGYGH